MKKLINGINQLTQKKYFYEILLAADLVFSFLGWLYFSSVALFVSAVAAVFFLFTTKSFRYSLPFVAQFIFLFNGDFLNNQNLYFFLGAVAVLVIGVFVYLLKSKEKHLRGRMSLSYALVGIACLIPIFYSAVPEGYKNYLIYYFQWIMYFLFYLIFLNLYKGDETREMCKSYGMIAVLLSLECMYHYFILKEEWYFIGWAHCNAANYLITLFVPLIIYLLVTEAGKRKWIYILEIVFCLLGGYSTQSRGFYVFMLLEAGVIVLYLLISNKKWKALAITCAAGVLAIGMIFAIPFTREKILNILLTGSRDYGILSGRIEIWTKSMQVFTESPRSILIGHGAFSWLSNDFDGGVLVPQACHSTIAQTLVMMGITGILVMGYHFYLKYSIFRKDHSLFGVLLLIGFIINDLAGLLDNTYHYYYFMFTFILIYGALESKNTVSSLSSDIH